MKTGRAGLRAPFLFVPISLVFTEAACLSPTQIAVVVRADGDVCASGAPVHAALFVGESRGVETDLGPTGVFDLPCGGAEATLFVTPSGGGDDIGVRVVANALGAAEDCNHAAGYPGCIVARRRLSFSSHTTRRLVVDLHAACVGKDGTCSVYGEGTCVSGGECRRADVDGERCRDDVCDETAVAAGL